MARARSFRRPAGRRRKTWDFLPALTSALTGDGTTIASGALSFTESGFTLVRSMVDLLVNMQVSGSVALDSVDLGIGLLIASTDSFTLGATAQPDPLGEPGFPWIFWKDMNLFAPVAVSDNTGFASTNMRVAIDTKAQRKIKSGESLFWVVQYSDIAGTPVMRLKMGRTRVLLAIP